MSNPILQSNQSSAVVATINESETMSPWVYNETNRLVTPHAMQILSISNSSGTVAASKTFSYDIAKNGLVQGLWLNMTLPKVAVPGTETQPTGALEQADGGLNLVSTNVGGFTALGLLGLIQEVRLTTSGRIVEALDKYQILARIADLPYGQRQSVQEAYRMGGDPERGANTDTYKACLWLPFFFSLDPSRYHINSNFQEPFRVEVSLSDCKIGYGLAGESTGTVLEVHPPSDCELLCHYRQLDEKALNDVVSKNYADGLLSQIVHISKTEAVASVSAGTLETTVELKENEAIQSLYVIVECPTVPQFKKTSDNTKESRYSTAIRTGAPLEVDEFELRFNNTTVMKVPGEFVRYFGRWGMHGQCGDGASTGQSASMMRHVYKIDFSLDYAKGAFSNCVALREISNPKLTVKFRDVHAGTPKTGFTAESAAHNIHVIYDTCTFLSTSSATGRVQLSISS